MSNDESRVKYVYLYIYSSPVSLSTSCQLLSHNSEFLREREREIRGGAGEMVVERDIDDLPKNNANYTALTPLWFLERAAVVHPTRKSVVHGSLHYTWQQTYQRCRRLASALSKCSIGLGTTVLY